MAGLRRAKAGRHREAQGVVGAYRQHQLLIGIAVLPVVLVVIRSPRPRVGAKGRVDDHHGRRNFAGLPHLLERRRKFGRLYHVLGGALDERHDHHQRLERVGLEGVHHAGLELVRPVEAERGAGLARRSNALQLPARHERQPGRDQGVLVDHGRQVHAEFLCAGDVWVGDVIIVAAGPIQVDQLAVGGWRIGRGGARWEGVEETGARRRGTCVKSPWVSGNFIME